MNISKGSNKIYSRNIKLDIGVWYLFDRELISVNNARVNDISKDNCVALSLYKFIFIL
jgi:hypothetical protein